jgi:adenine-specific DNA-methyltransferase
VAKPDEELPKFDLSSEDIADVRRQELLRLFPEAHTESGDVNFEALRLSLGDAVQSGPESFGMSWPGKAECAKTIQKQSIATLLPVEKESVNWDTTQNVIIEGDNLEVLKVLQKAYLGKVKMIYIDPPYNTGNDFIYPDNYTESLKTYLQYTGQVDNEGRKFSTHTESSGRFHSKWMNMMYPRLSLARNLLSEDGVVFISIDDSEFTNLRIVCNEIFGEENLAGIFPWRRSTGANDSKFFNRSITHEYVVAYAKSENFKFSGIRKSDSGYTNPDNDPRGPWTRGDLTCNKTKDERPNLYYPITDPETKVTYQANPSNVWRFSKETMRKYLDAGKILFPKTAGGQPAFKRHLADLQSEVKPLGTYVFSGNSIEETSSEEDDEENYVGGLLFPLNTAGSRELKLLLGASYFPYPKSTQLIRALLEQVGPDDLILDFFAGSGTTGQAVYDQNLKDGGARKFLLVQLPEEIDEDSVGAMAGFKTVVDITVARLTAAGKQIVENHPQLQMDCGFRKLKLDKSNFAAWDASAIEGDEAKLEQQLFVQVEHVLPGRTNQDILFELMLKSRYELTTQVEKVKVGKCEVWKVAGGELVAIIDSGLTIEVIREVANWKPVSVVILDRCFGADDSLKANARKTFEDSKIDLKTV